MFQTNPNLIQEPLEWSYSKAVIPLVLIHDGGGTVFSYYLLDDLKRPMYGIHNPRFYSKVPWLGGIPEMARHYVDLIKSVIPSGRLIVGGWSMGGMLSLEVVRLLADDPRMDVVGIIMIDSYCPRTPPGGWESLGLPPVVKRKIDWAPTTKMETRLAVENCFSEAVRMIREWKLPEWTAQDSDMSREAPRVGATRALRRPPTILLRSRDPVPVEEDGIAMVDVFREDRRLGWDNYDENMFTEIIDIPGHHFSVFAFENLTAVTNAIITACDILEEIL